jgi:hypothetical protein
MKDQCVYCGRPADTRDHVPAKSFFPEPRPDDLITVPSCKACNESYAKDEEYVRNLLASTWEDGEESEVVRLFNQKVTKSLVNSPALLQKMWESIEPVLVGAPGNQSVTTAFRVDTPRFDRVMTKISRGLHFHETRLALSSDCQTRVFLHPDPSRFVVIFESLAAASTRGSHPEVFRYRFSLTPGGSSAWILQFYGRVNVLVLCRVRAKDQAGALVGRPS